MAGWLKKGTDVLPDTELTEIYIEVPQTTLIPESVAKIKEWRDEGKLDVTYRDGKIIFKRKEPDLMKDGGTLFRSPEDMIFAFNTAQYGSPDPLTEPVPDVPPCEDGYDRLRAVFDAALHQASEGKGKERHADPDVPFEEQGMIRRNKKFRGFCLGQVDKKCEESLRLAPPHAIHELLGAIVHIAGEIITIEDELKCE
jgi:hypothetical protein